MKRLTLLLLFISSMAIGQTINAWEKDKITYSGQWNIPEEIATGCKCAYSNITGDYLTYSFSSQTPVTIKIIGEKVKTHGTVKIEVNDITKVVDQYSETSIIPFVLFSAKLPAGVHNVKLTVKSELEKNPLATNNYTVLHRIEIVPESVIPDPADTVEVEPVDITPTQLEALFSGSKYYSVIKDDTVIVFTKNDSTYQLVGKYSYNAKLMSDVHVVNKNVNKLEIWLIIISAVMVVLAGIIYLEIKKGQMPKEV